MSDLIRLLCDRLAQGTDLDPRLLAARLGTVDEGATTSLIRVVPFDARFTSTEVLASETSGQTSSVILVPADGQLTLGTLQDQLGAYDESPRLHPYDPRKLVFAPHTEGGAYRVGVVAQVSADEPVNASASIQRLAISCSPAVGEDRDHKPASKTRTMWARLQGAPARFAVSTLRDSNLDEICSEIEGALGIEMRDTGSELECVTPACDLRLSSSPSETPQMRIFNLVGVTSGSGESISETVAAHLRGAGCDWYLPPAPVADERLLDPTAVRSVVAPRWLAWCNAEERDIGIDVLTGVAEMWLAAARRASDPVAEVRRRIAEFHGWSQYSPPKARLSVLVSYAIQEQLTMIEDEVFRLSLMSEAERAAMPELALRLAEWRDVVAALAEPARKTLADSIVRQQQQVLASINDLAQRVPLPGPATEKASDE